MGLQADKLEPFVKSEEPPKDNSGPVKIVTAGTFDEIVFGGKNVLIEFYAPWCGHCKKLAPAYEEVSSAKLLMPHEQHNAINKVCWSCLVVFVPSALDLIKQSSLCIFLPNQQQSFSFSMKERAQSLYCATWPNNLLLTFKETLRPFILLLLFSLL